MTPDARRLLVQVLGEPGAAILTELVKSDPTLAYWLIPRVAQASLADRVETPNASLCRSAQGWSGVAQIMGSPYEFENVSRGHAVAVITAATATPVGPLPARRGVELARLGQTVDRLAKATRGQAGGVPAAHIRQLEPAGPTPPQGPSRAGGKAQKPSMHLSEAEAAKPCPICRKPQAGKAGVTLCACLKDLRRSLTVEPEVGGFRLELGPAWGAPEIDILLEAIGRARR